MQSEDVKAFLKKFSNWARSQTNITALALVGSYARGTATPQSDLDLVILANEPAFYLSDLSWLQIFGKIEKQQIEDYGRLISVRVWYSGAREIEFGITGEDWAAQPLDEGTRQVLRGGMKILFERNHLLNRLAGDRPGVISSGKFR